MTVSSVINHEQYVGNGTTTVFSFRFLIFKDSHMVVTLSDPLGNQTTLTLGTDYTISGVGLVSGGSVTLYSAPPDGWIIYLDRQVPAVQETDLRNQGSFFAETHEDAFDYLTMLIQQALYGVDFINNRALRVPLIEPYVKPLPILSSRANKMLAFDAAGQPIAVLPPNGSASEVLIELAKPTGSSLIGVMPSGKLSDALYFVTPEMFGALSDGSTDDRVAINAAIATGKPVMMQGYYNVSSGSINILPGTRLISKGARIKSTSTTSAMIYAVNVDDWNIEGRLSLIGLGSTTDSGQIGILESGCQNYRVDNVTASGIAGRAFYQNTVGTWEAPRGNKGTWTNCAAYYCYRGHEDIANNSSDNLMNEFTTWMNFKASGCQVGVRTSAGNCQFIGGMLVDNVEGFTSPEVGTNTTHGQCVGMTIAHNSLYNVNMVAQTAGFTFSGCSIYGDSPTVGVVRLDRCRGIKFVGGNFEASIYNDGPGTNFVIGCYNNNNFAFFRSGSNPEGIVITDLYDQNGYSSRNDVFWGHSEATLTGNALYSYMVSNYAGRIGFNFATRDPQKTLDVTNAATMGYKYCRISGRVGVSTKIHITGMTAGATAYLTLVRVRAGVANEDVCYQVIPPYTTTAVAGCLNSEVSVLAGDALFIKLTLSTGDGTISASRTEFASHYIGGAG